MAISRFIVLTVFCLLTLATAYGQSKQDTIAILANIKTVFKQSNGYKHYKIAVIDDAAVFLGQSTDNGGSLKGYFKKDSVQKIVAWIGLSNKVIQNEYYFDKEQLVFVFATEKTYGYNERTQSIDFAKPVRVVEGRYYFYEGKLFFTILADAQRAGSKEEDAAHYLQSGKDYLQLLKAKLK